MDKAAEVLVIITSSVLVVFLVACIIAIVRFIQLLHSLQRISEKAERLADSAEHIGAFFEKATGPMMFGNFVKNVAQQVFHHSTKEGKDHHHE